MKKPKMSTREKLELMKEIDQRNEQRRKEFVKQEQEKKARDEKLLDMYLDGEITKEELYKRIKE